MIAISHLWPLRQLCLALMILAAAALTHAPVSKAADEQAKPAPKGNEPASETVKVVIDYGDGSQKQFSAVAWKQEMTVFAALEAAAKHPRGFKFVHQGKGETVLITAIDDLKNEGRGRNWLYEVNGKLGDRSCAVMPLKAGDSVLWRFGKYQ